MKEIQEMIKSSTDKFEHMIALVLEDFRAYEFPPDMDKESTVFSALLSSVIVTYIMNHYDYEYRRMALGCINQIVLKTLEDRKHE